MDGFRRLVADLAADDLGATFNFLREEDPGLDVPGAAAMRRANLLHYLESRAGARIVGLGEAAGYAGARWSGIAFTSERTLASWGEPYEPTYALGKTWSEQAATIVHAVLGELEVEEHVLLWNTVPTHPRRAGEPLTNRRPSVAEIAAGATYARRVVALVRPEAVVAIGRLAETAFAGARYVRHPSNAGAAEFAGGMRQVVDDLRSRGALPPPRGAS